MCHLRRVIIVVILITTFYFGSSALYKHFDPHTKNSAEENEDARWVATSSNCLDRLACRWISLCGLAHWHPDPAARRWTRRTLKGHGSFKRESHTMSSDESRSSHLWEDIPFQGEWIKRGDWEIESRSLKDIPQYVIDNAPLIHLSSNEKFWPSDITQHLMYTTPYLNHTSLNMSNHQHTPQNLHLLNENYTANHLFLHSKDDVERRPDWLGSEYNKPNPYVDGEDSERGEQESHAKSSHQILNPEEQENWFNASKADQKLSDTLSADDSSLDNIEKAELRRIKKRSTSHLKGSTVPSKPGGYSNAPSILIIVNKGSDIVDVFWFFFYSYNLGTTVLDIRFGNHIGDWEHSLIRFHKGEPKAIFCSAHSGGLAYAWEAVEKGRGKNREGRPVLYSAVGSHAMYATPGRHPYILPLGLLADVTDRGPLWDPALNYLGYYHNTSTNGDQDARSLITNDSVSAMSHDNSSASTEGMRASFQPATSNPSAPLGWLWYAGHWGDKFYELRDWRQWRFFGQYHYVNGPFGPRFKNLGRSTVCQNGPDCRIVKNLSERRSWIGL